MCIIGDYRQIIAQREMGLTYSEIQVPRKKINRALQHNPGLTSLRLHGHKSGDKEKTS